MLYFRNISNLLNGFPKNWFDGGRNTAAARASYSDGNIFTAHYFEHLVNIVLSDEDISWGNLLPPFKYLFSANHDK